MKPPSASGKPTTQMVPIEEDWQALTPEQEASRRRALERMRRGINLGGASFDRDELHVERVGRRAT